MNGKRSWNTQLPTPKDLSSIRDVGNQYFFQQKKILSSRLKNTTDFPKMETIGEDTVLEDSESKEPSRSRDTKKKAKDSIQIVMQYHLPEKGEKVHKILKDVAVSNIQFNHVNKTWKLCLAEDIPIRPTRNQPKHSDQTSKYCLLFRLDSLTGESITPIIPVDDNLCRGGSSVINFYMGWDVCIKKDKDFITSVELLRRGQ